MKYDINKRNAGLIENEIGDVFFSVVNLSRKLNIEPEKALRSSTDKFVLRINSALTEIKKENLDITEINREKLDEIWNSVKKAQGEENE